MSSGMITPELPRIKDYLVVKFVYYGLKASIFIKVDNLFLLGRRRYRIAAEKTFVYSAGDIGLF